MNPDQQGNAMAVLQEEARRRFGQSGAPSNVGTSPNPSTSTNPLALRQGGSGQQSPAQAMNGGAISAMNGASPKPGGSELITKALIKRLNMYDPAAF